MTDVLELILDEHQRICELLDALRQPARSAGPQTAPALTGTWRSLATLLELHTEAEQEIVHPLLWCLAPETVTWLPAAVADHDDIREAMREADLQPAGSAAWRQAVGALQRTATRHIAWEERALRAVLPRRAGSRTRDQLGRQWVSFTSARLADSLGLAGK